jgi:N4-gp56 family major capsid protein
MSDTQVAPGLTVEQWDDKFFVEYLTENRFAGEMGTDENSIIQVKENLTKKKGDRINFALVNKLTNEATTGRDTLEGNEEEMDSRSFPVTVNKRRNAIRLAEIDEQFSAIELRDAGKAVLKDWSLKDSEKLIIRSLMSKNGVRYASASEANKDAWLVDNADRVLFGKVRSNGSSNDHSTSLATLDTTDDLATPAAISKMKQIALTIANPRIRPIRSAANGKRYFKVWAHPYAFADLKDNAEIKQAQREVMLEVENNRLFQGGDLLWDGCIISQIEDDAVSEWFLDNAGSGGTTDVVSMFLCGAQAVGAAYAKRWRTQTKEFDYGDKWGVAVDSIYGIEKLRFGTGENDTDDYKDHGVVTGYFATSGLT